MEFEYEGKRPQIGQEVFIAPTAVIIGNVVIGDGTSVWYGAVLRGDDGQIVIGRGCSIQDNAVLHTTPTHPTTLADDVTIGHGALLEGCTIESNAVIGMNAVVLESAVVEEQAMVAALSVVKPGTRIPSGTLAVGVPAVVKKRLAEDALQVSADGVATYRNLTRSYRNQRLDDIDTAI